MLFVEMNTRWQPLQDFFRSSCCFCFLVMHYEASLAFTRPYICSQDKIINVPFSRTSPWSLFPIRCGMSRIPLLNCSFVWKSGQICKLEIPCFLQRLEPHSQKFLIECHLSAPTAKAHRLLSDTLRGPWGPHFDMTVTCGRVTGPDSGHQWW